MNGYRGGILGKTLRFEARPRIDLGDVNKALGESLVEQGAYEGALVPFHDHLQLAHQLAEEHPENDEYHRRMIEASHSLAECYQLMGRQAEARSLFRDAIERTRQRIAVRREGASATRLLVWELQELGHAALIVEGDPRAARYALRESIDLVKTASAPSTPNDYLELSVMYRRLGQSCIDAEDFEEAIDAFRQGTKLLQQTAEAGSQLVELKNFLAASEALPKVLDDVGFALNQPAPVARHLLAMRCRVLIARGDLAAAVKTVDAFRKLPPRESAKRSAADPGSEEWEDLLVMAHLYTRCASAVGRRVAQHQLGDADRLRRGRYMESAIGVLEEAVELGFGRDDPAVLTQDYELILLHEHPRYKSRLKQILRKQGPDS